MEVLPFPPVVALCCVLLRNVETLELIRLASHHNIAVSSGKVFVFSADFSCWDSRKCLNNLTTTAAHVSGPRQR